jgi:hypothetical protein
MNPRNPAIRLLSILLALAAGDMGALNRSTPYAESVRSTNPVHSLPLRLADLHASGSQPSSSASGTPGMFTSSCVRYR